MSSQKKIVQKKSPKKVQKFVHGSTFIVGLTREQGIVPRNKDKTKRRSKGYDRHTTCGVAVPKRTGRLLIQTWFPLWKKLSCNRGPFLAVCQVALSSPPLPTDQTCDSSTIFGLGALVTVQIAIINTWEIIVRDSLKGKTAGW
jgi:hypothetical protein